MYPTGTVFSYREAHPFDICEGHLISLPEYGDRMLVVVSKMLLEKGVTVTTDEGMLLTRDTHENSAFFWSVYGIRPNSAAGREAIETVFKDYRPSGMSIESNSDRSLRRQAEEAGMGPSEDLISTEDEG